MLKVGVLDSGAGGLTVLSAILATKRQLEMHYFADEAFSPYGSLSVHSMQQRVIRLCEFLIDLGVSAIVIACNTATLETISLIRNLQRVKEGGILVVGVEPAIKPASLIDDQGVVCVLATPTRCQSERLKNLIQSNSKQPSKALEYHCIESHLLANLIDTLPESRVLLEQELNRIKEIIQALNARVLVLACTHYPLIKPRFEALFDYPVLIIEPSQAVAERLLFCLNEAEYALAPIDKSGKSSAQNVFLYSSGDAKSLLRVRAWLSELVGEIGKNDLNITLRPDCLVD